VFPPYVANLSHTYYIPVTPKQQALQLHLRWTHVSGPSVRGLAFNGVVLMHLLHKCDITHTHWHHLMMLEDISIWHAGYHYHAATYLTTQIAQTDGHAAMIDMHLTDMECTNTLALPEQNIQILMHL
jgi:hypothetical protein